MKETKEIKEAKPFSSPLSDFLEFVRNSEQRYKIAEVEEQEANDANQDILHSLELQEHTYHEFAALGKKQKELRIKRRDAKDVMNQTLPIVTWAGENQALIKSLEKLLGDVRKAERNTQNRVYTPRTNEIDKNPKKKAG